jgi:hypothetical protein
MIKFKIQKEKKINFGGRSNKVAQYMTDYHVCPNKREDSWNFSESRYLIFSKKYREMTIICKHTLIRIMIIT